MERNDVFVIILKRQIHGNKRDALLIVKKIAAGVLLLPPIPILLAGGLKVDDVSVWIHTAQPNKVPGLALGALQQGVELCPCQFQPLDIHSGTAGIFPDEKPLFHICNLL
jgi:hypothetical protein